MNTHRKFYWLKWVYLSFMLSLLTACGGSETAATPSPTPAPLPSPANKQPIANITPIASDISYTPTTSVTLSGTASDPEDGTLSDGALVWKSSKDGDLGTGTSISILLSAGAHTIMLTATDSKGLTYTDFVTILVKSSDQISSNSPPQITITSPNSGSSFNATDTVILSGSAIDIEDGTIDSSSLRWSSSIDGDLGSGNDVSVTLSVGTHLISLTAIDSNGAENIATIAISSTSITSNNIPPLANAGQPQSVSLGGLVSLDGSQSFDSDGGTISYLWNFESIPSGSSATLNNATSVTPNFVADLAGDYVVKLTVNDGQMNSAPVTVLASTYNFAPIAHAGFDQTVLLGNQVTLNGSASTDIELSPLTYLWSIDTKPDTSNITLSDLTVSNPTFTPDVQGEYDFSLIVNDGLVDSITDQVKIIAGNVKPVAHIEVIRPSNLYVGSIITFDGQASFDANGDSLSYLWTIVAKPNGSIAQLSSDSAIAPTLIADKVGSYQVSLVVSDNEFAGNLVSADVFVANQTTTLAGIGFETDIDGFTGTWERVTTKFHSGSFALQPPELTIGGTSSAELVYNTSHTQISFWNYGFVALYIDGVFYQSYNIRDWRHHV
ncbi:MAG: hypothetical protein COB35_13455, partial [Gammaproteobacteria bacterium]